MGTTVLFHANCPDGWASAFACWQQFGDAATYLPVTYGQPMPSIPTDHTTYVVDFSYPTATLEAFLATRGASQRDMPPQVILLDHHASAQRDLATLQAQALPGLAIFFDLEESGASLTWKYFRTGGWHPRHDPEAQGLEHSLPLFFKYVRDRDLWRWDLPDSRPISLTYWAIPKDFSTIAQFAEDLEGQAGYDRIVAAGSGMECYAQRLIAEQAARVFYGVVGGYCVPIVNATTLFSEVGDYLCTTQPTYPFCAYYFDRPDGQRQWGLRGRGALDLSQVASTYGGGGHAQAAGFTTAVGWLPASPPPPSPS